MLKKVFLAAAASLILAGATVTVSPAPALACIAAATRPRRPCIPTDRKARHAYVKACKAKYKAWKKAHKKHHLFGK